MRKESMTTIEPMTNAQASALADMLAELRPKDWRKPQLLKLFWEHRTEHPFADLALAAVRAAANPAVKSPDVIFMPGAHWDMPEIKTPAPRPDPCPDHIGEPSHACRCCRADFLAGIRPPDMIGRHYEPPTEDHEAPANAGA